MNLPLTGTATACCLVVDDDPQVRHALARVIEAPFLREALRLYPDMAILMLTGVAEVTTAVECLTAVQLSYTGDRLEHIRLGGELHDIGKIGTPRAFSDVSALPLGV